MKKLMLLLLLTASVTVVFAQNRNVTRANSLSRAETPNFTEARTLINAALEDPSTKNLANTWFVAGMVGYREVKSITESRAVLLGQAQIDWNRAGQALMASLNHLIVADSLDHLPDDRGRVRPRHRREIHRVIGEYYRYYLLQYADHLVQRQEFASALTVLNSFLAIPDLPAIEGTIEKDLAFYEVMYFTARVASNADQPQYAIQLFERVRKIDEEMGMEIETIMLVYQLLYLEYYDLNDAENSIKVLKEGFERFPEELWFFQNLINHYVGLEEFDTALKYLEIAIEREPNIAEFHRLKGALHEQLENEDKAEAAYLRALEVDPNLITALDALGLFYLRRAAIIDDTIFSIRDAGQRRAAEERFRNELRSALPLYQRLVELEPETMGHKIRLRNIYHNLRMDQEFDALNRRIEELLGN